MAEICIAARVNVTGYTDDAKPDEFAREMVSKTDHHKCGRCWRHLPEVAQDGALCARCDSVVAAMDSVSA
jgi:isoleucyl-tRNA synthetase